MSTTQRSYACRITVDPSTADVLREEAKKVLEFNHDHFEDLREFSPAAQCALSLMFSDAFAIINAVGWDPEPGATEPVEVRLTDALIEQLRRRRHDLAFTNKDRLDGLDVNEPIDPGLLAEITTDRLAAQALDGVFGAYTRAVTAT
jgi:hypothetical protein